MRMAKHYIIRRDDVVQSYHFKSEKEFRKNYVKAVPHRPRKYERRFKKRVRLYVKAEYYRTTVIINPHGTGRVGKPREKWSFNVQSTIFTTQRIEEDEVRFNAMVSVAEKLRDWIIDHFGFYNITHDTAGVSTDKRIPKQDAEAAGLWINKLTVKDILVAQGNYRLRRNINVVNACMLVESCKSELYSVRSGEVVAWVASDILLCK